jgi:hypothetical protein
LSEEESAIGSVGLFNYAHTYAASAAALADTKVDATHCDSPVYFMYYHAIELYLKSYLLKKGHSLGELRSRKFGHNLRTLVDTAKSHGLSFEEKYEDDINLLDTTDSVISSRYLRIGTHTRLPLFDLDNFCRYLNNEIEPIVYDPTGIKRRPKLWKRPDIRAF